MFILVLVNYLKNIRELSSLTFLSICRSSRPEVFCKKDVLRNFAKFTGNNTCARVSFLIKLQASACNFSKKEALPQVFSCEFCKRTPFHTEHLRWLLFLYLIGRYFRSIFLDLFWKMSSQKYKSSSGKISLEQHLFRKMHSQRYLKKLIEKCLRTGYVINFSPVTLPIHYIIPLLVFTSSICYIHNIVL